MPAQVSALYIYPVKSCKALPQREARVEPRGLAGDRRFLVVDANGKFITGREHPRLTLLLAEPEGVDTRLQTPDGRARVVTSAAFSGRRLEVTIWDDAVGALLADEATNAWLSAYLEAPCRLVFMDAQAIRPVRPHAAQSGDEVSFADGFPLMMISQASLDALNQRLQTPASMLNFRPNLIIEGCAPHEEDTWKRIRIGEVELDVVSACMRCVFTTLDPETGTRARNGEPLRTLTQYRRREGGVAFGMNGIARQLGRIRIGDPIEVLA